MVLGVAFSRFRLPIASGLGGLFGSEAGAIVPAFVFLKHLPVMPSAWRMVDPAVLVAYDRTFLRRVVSRGGKGWWKK